MDRSSRLLLNKTFRDFELQFSIRYLYMQQSVATSNDTNQAFGNNNEDKREHSISQNRGNFNRVANNGVTSPPPRPPPIPAQNEIQSQFQKLKKPTQNIQRQTSLPVVQHEFTGGIANPGSSYSDKPNRPPAYEGTLKSRRASDSNFQKESRQAIVGEIER